MTNTESVNTSLIEKLLDALNITGGVKTASSVIIALGAILICGFLMTRLTKLLKLPNVTAYIITGVLIGPSVINLIPQEFITRTDFVSDIALAFIAFTAGQFFKISELKKAGWKVLIITVLNAGSPIASLKLRKPIKPPTIPDFEISLKDSRNTMAIGNTTKIAISTMLGSSHR